MKWTETITPKQAAEELGVPYHGWMREMDRAWISEDQKYSVMSRLLRTEWGKVEHVTITAAEGVGRSDGSGDIPWAVKMEIKNDLFGEKRVAVEVFPTQDRLVDVCDCYHLWVFEKGFQLPFGIHPRDKKTLTEYARQLVKGHGSSIDLNCNDMELSESLTDHLFDDPKQSIDGLIAEHYTILWAYATLREKLKWYEDAGIPVIPNYGLSTIRRAINRYGTAPQLQMAIKEMSELTKAICNLQRAVTFNYRNGAKIKVAHESVREEIADVYIMLAQLVEIVGKPEEVQQIVLEKLEQLKGDLDGGEVQSE